MRRYEYIFALLTGFFVTSLVVSNSMINKLTDVPLPFIGLATISVGTLPYPVTFLCTDLVSEVYGKRRADMLVIIGFVVSGYMLLLLYLGRVLPLSHMQDGSVQDDFVAVFGQSTRAIIASMVAYMTAQFIDVRLYHYWRRLTKGKHLWLRNNASTLLSQLIDTVAVVTILFLNTLTFPELRDVIVSSYIYKLLVALADTPLMYLGTRLFKDIKQESIKRGLIHESV